MKNKKTDAMCKMSKDGKTNKEIAEYFYCSTGYVSRILTDNGIHHKSELPPDIDIIESYKKTLSSNKTADIFGINQKSVLKILHKHNVATTGIQHYRLTAERYPREIQEEIKTLYESGISANELKTKYGGSLNTIYQAICRVGGKIRPPRGKKQIIISPEEEKQICELYKQGHSQKEIGNKLERDQKTISRILIKNGIRTIKREKHPNYKGGRTMHHEGYVYVWISEDDPMASMRINQGYVLEHRLVMAQKIGRPLTPTETVHHIDGNKQNNHPDNLQLHIGRHGKGQAMKCVDCNSNNILSLEWLQCGDCNSTKISFTSI